MVVYYGVGNKGVSDGKTKTTFENRAAKLENTTGSFHFHWSHRYPFDGFIFNEINFIERLEQDNESGFFRYTTEDSWNKNGGI